MFETSFLFYCFKFYIPLSYPLILYFCFRFSIDKSIVSWQTGSIYSDMFGIYVMTTHLSMNLQLLPQQRATLSNAHETVVQPIQWDLILARNVPKFKARSVRAYLVGICNKLNKHFAIVMSGPQIGCIEVTRLNRIPDRPPIKVVLSPWRCQQLFTRRVNIKWMEEDKVKKINMTAFTLWMKSRNRREVQPEYKNPQQPPNIAVQWLRSMLSLSETDACPIKFNCSNNRQDVYMSWWEMLDIGQKEDWHPKRISEAIYRLLPAAKPARGTRRRLKGTSVIDIPDIYQCQDAMKIHTAPLHY